MLIYVNYNVAKSKHIYMLVNFSFIEAGVKFINA